MTHSRVCLLTEDMSSSHFLFAGHENEAVCFIQQYQYVSTTYYLGVVGCPSSGKLSRVKPRQGGVWWGNQSRIFTLTRDGNTYCYRNRAPGCCDCHVGNNLPQTWLEGHFMRLCCVLEINLPLRVKGPARGAHCAILKFPTTVFKSANILPHDPHTCASPQRQPEFTYGDCRVFCDTFRGHIIQ